MSMAMGAIIKKYKRTLTNFQEDFLVPLIKKAAFRYMQFDPERYPSVDMKFIPTATLGIMAREYEQQQLIGLLQTLGPDTPVLPVILKGIIANSSLSNRAEMEMALEQMSQPNPEAQQMAQMAQQLQMEQAQAQTQSLQARAQRDQAEAAKTVVETQLMPEELKAKVISSLSTNIEGDNADKEFEKRAKIAELMLKEKDINNKGKIVELQMQKNANNT
jgi:formaldehyde-activating enzyme involved in methanogenesis